jgi:hypothetical protein
VGIVTSGFYYDVKDVLGERGQVRTIGLDGTRYSALLYAAFPFRIRFDRDARRFEIEISEVPDGVADRLRAEVAAIPAEPAALVGVLAAVDRAARAALPDKYLRRFDSAYAVGPLG